MPHEVTTLELAEILSCTKKTIADWANKRILVKIAHGKFDLRESLRNWAEYKQCLAEGCTFFNWQMRYELRWSQEHPNGETDEELERYRRLYSDDSDPDAQPIVTIDERLLSDEQTACLRACVAFALGQEPSGRLKAIGADVQALLSREPLPRDEAA